MPDRQVDSTIVGMEQRFLIIAMDLRGLAAIGEILLSTGIALNPIKF